MQKPEEVFFAPHSLVRLSRIASMSEIVIALGQNLGSFSGHDWLKSRQEQKQSQIEQYQPSRNEVTKDPESKRDFTVRLETCKQSLKNTSKGALALEIFWSFL